VKWSLTYISTGEIGLADIVAEMDKRVHGGQMVRLIEQSSDAGQGQGLFENLHGMESASDFADHLKQMSRTYYGTPIREFLRIITGDRERVERRLCQLRGQYVSMFGGDVGEVVRVGRVFALEAAVGEFCIQAGVLPWREGSALSALQVCFERWLDQRGTTGSLDDELAVRHIRGFIEAHPDRFQWHQNESKEGASFKPSDIKRNSDIERQARVPVRDRVGFRRHIGNGEHEFWFLPESFKSICSSRGFSPDAVAQALKSRGFLTTERDHNAVKRALPDHSKPIRVYVVNSRILGD